MKKYIVLFLLLLVPLVYADDPFAPGGSRDGSSLVNLDAALLSGELGDNFQPIDTDLTYLSGFTPTTDVKAILNAADDDAIKALLDTDDIQTSLGTSAGAVNFGTFTGTLLSDNLTLKALLQEIETVIASVVDSIVDVADPDADRFSFWDDSAGTIALIAPGANLEINETTLRSIVPVVTDADGFSMSAAQGYGYVVYATGAGTIVMPPVAAGMQFTVENHTDGDVVLNPDATGTEDTIRLDGQALAQGDSITGTDYGDSAVCTYYAADTWSCMAYGYVDSN